MRVAPILIFNEYELVCYKIILLCETAIHIFAFKTFGAGLT